MNNLVPAQSRRTLSGVYLGIPARVMPASTTLTALLKTYRAAPVQLLRTREGRALSRQRIRRAKEFMPSIEPGVSGPSSDFFYSTGICVQLALSSHLLDVGFPDAWCALNIGLHLDKSLAYANATGFGLACHDTARLAQVLSPYWKWNGRSQLEHPRPDDGGFTAEETQSLLHALMNHVHHVTGHGLVRPPR
jgi:hypothetical protein